MASPMSTAKVTLYSESEETFNPRGMLETVSGSPVSLDQRHRPHPSQQGELKNSQATKQQALANDLGTHSIANCSRMAILILCLICDLPRL